MGKIRLACVGDSITCGFGLRSGCDYPAVLGRLLGDDWEVANCGASGAVFSRDRPNSYDPMRVADVNPDKIVVMLGTNDALAEVRLDLGDVCSDFRELVRHLTAGGCRGVLVVLPPPAWDNVWFDVWLLDRVRELLAVACQQGKLPYLDLVPALRQRRGLFSDGVHPSAGGAGLIADAVASKVRSLCRP